MQDVHARRESRGGSLQPTTSQGPDQRSTTLSGTPAEPLYTCESVAGFPAGDLGRPGELPRTPGIPRDMSLERPRTMRQFSRYAKPEGINRRPRSFREPSLAANEGPGFTRGVDPRHSCPVAGRAISARRPRLAAERDKPPGRSVCHFSHCGRGAVPGSARRGYGSNLYWFATDP